MKIIFSIHDSGPLSVRSRRETAGAETRTYVPGATVVGALAAAHAQQRDDPQEFNAFFGQGSRFSNLYPASFDDERLQQTNQTPVYPLPATAISCKRFGGFHFDQKIDGEPHHGVHDTAVASTLFALSGETRLEVLQPFDYCGDTRNGDGRACNEPMDRFEGYYRRLSRDAKAVGSAQVRRGLRTRTGISRLTGAAEQGNLYSREVINAGTSYWGTAEVPDICADRFTEFLQEVSEQGLVRFGNNRTRGFGGARVLVERRRAESADSVDSLLERLKAFDALLRRQAREEGIAADDDLYLTLTLTADAILPDRLLRYATRIDGDYLAGAWDIGGARLLFQSGGVRRVMGWNGALGIPKADDGAIALGSVFVLGFDRPLDRPLAQKLLALQEQGIGVRRREGFGQLVVASPFHYEAKGI